MIISHKHKFIYIAIPRTGSTSIREALKEYNEEPLVYPYTPLIELSKKFNLDGYFKFCFFRNPWDMMLSVYYYKKHMAKLLKFNDGFDHDKNDFNEWLKKNCFIMNNSFKNYKSMWDMASNDKNDLDVNFLGFFEDIDLDFNYVMGILGLKFKLKHLNKNSNKINIHYSHFYNKESIDLVLKTFTKEINYMGYSFG